MATLLQWLVRSRARWLRRALLGWVALSAALQAAPAQTVTVYTNANFAPLAQADGHGLYPDLVAHLNRHRPGGLSFRLVQLPRVRLQQMLERGELDGIVIGVTPAWFDDPDEQKYLWTAPFFNDGFVLLSRAARPVRHAAPELPAHAPIGMTHGYVYPGLDAWLARHRLRREDAPNEQSNLDKFLKGRVAAAVLTSSVARHHIRSLALEGLLLEPLPSGRTARRLLVPKSQRAVFEVLAPLLKKLATEPAWQAIAAGY